MEAGVEPVSFTLQMTRHVYTQHWAAYRANRQLEKLLNHAIPRCAWVVLYATLFLSLCVCVCVYKLSPYYTQGGGQWSGGVALNKTGGIESNAQQASSWRECSTLCWEELTHSTAERIDFLYSRHREGIIYTKTQPSPFPSNNNNTKYIEIIIKKKKKTFFFFLCVCVCVIQASI